MDGALIGIIWGIIGGAVVAATPGIIALIANRRKTKADTAQVLVGTSLSMVTKLEDQVKNLSIKVEECAKMKEDFRILEAKVGVLEKENVYLREGVGVLIGQLRKRGIEPEFVLAEN